MTWLQWLPGFVDWSALEYDGREHANKPHRHQCHKDRTCYAEPPNRVENSFVRNENREFDGSNQNGVAQLGPEKHLYDEELSSPLRNGESPAHLEQPFRFIRSERLHGFSLSAFYGNCAVIGHRFRIAWTG